MISDMTEDRKRYAADHWIRSDDTEAALRAYMDQQSKAYSRVKNDFVRELLGDLAGKRFLDFGCGGGMFTVHAAKSGASMILGVDAEPSVLETARLFAAKEDVDQLCRFVSSANFPRFAPGTLFDVILIKDVLEHVEHDDELLRTARRFTAPGGRIVLSTQNSLSMNYLIEGAYQRLILGNDQWMGWDSTHLRFYTTFSLDRNLRQAGFTPIAWRSVYLIPYKLPALPGSKKEFLRIDPLSYVDRALGGVYPFNRLGWNIIVRADASREAAERVILKNREKGKVYPAAAAVVPPG